MHRSSYTATHPNYYHVFGGAFKPPTEINNHDRNNLEMTMIREVFIEELGIENVNLEETVRPLIPSVYMLNFEPDLGYLGVHWLGVNLPLSLFRQVEGSSEGNIEVIPIAELKDHLIENKWVPMGVQTILYWLSIGAPISGNQLFFDNKKEAKILLEEYLKQKIPEMESFDKILEEIPSPQNS